MPHHEHASRHGHRGQDVGMRNLTDARLKGTQYERDWFTYFLPFGSLATLLTATQSFNIQADSDFELMQIAASANVDGAEEPWPDNIILPFNMFITDTGTGRNLMSAATPLSLLAGNGKLPFILPQDRVFEKKSTVTVQLTNYGGSTYDNIGIAFIGAKLFQYTGGRR